MTLYGLVEAYAALGEHRTGTSVDEATIEWFCTQLVARGATVQRVPYTFDRYDATWSITADGEPVTSLPLFYEGVGKVRTDRAVIGEVDPFTLMFARPEEPFVAEATARATGVVLLATTGPSGSLTVPNRAPRTPGPVPVILVAGDAADAIRNGPIEVEIDARITPGVSANVVGTWGDGADPLVIATPLSGWFSCAGERGTGIAIALDVAARLAEERPVTVVGTTGHELVDLGLQRLLVSAAFGSPTAILHLGACIAAMTEGGELVPTRVCNAAVAGASERPLAEALGELGLVPKLIPRSEMTDATRWLGEAQEWCSLGVPLVSLTGHYRYFHTPEDVPEVATTEPLLARASDALTAVGEILSRDGNSWR